MIQALLGNSPEKDLILGTIFGCFGVALSCASTQVGAVRPSCCSFSFLLSYLTALLQSARGTDGRKRGESTGGQAATAEGRGEGRDGFFLRP